jgi:hypothetical protein
MPINHLAAEIMKAVPIIVHNKSIFFTDKTGLMGC